jgi:hypothetical protein
MTCDDLYLTTNNITTINCDQSWGYYDDTWIDYRCLWLNSVNHAIHFGYRDGSRRSRAESLLKTNQVLAQVAAIGPATGCSMPGAE